jgi:hypothetical protein
MRYVSPVHLEFETQPAGLRKKGIVALAPLVMLVWLVYWVGMVSQTCCQPLLAVAHHLSHTGEHDDDHHHGELADHEQDAPTDHECCPELKNADLVPASTLVLMDRTSQPVLIVSLSLVAPEPNFSTHTSYLLSKQTHPPPNRFLRTRRLLI